MTITRSTLYKTSSKGKETQWIICCGLYNNGTAYYEVTHGQVGGKLQTNRVDVLKGKNLGKKNETTCYIQAQLEAKSKWNKQQDKGYTLVKGATNLSRRPMLAHPFEKYEHQVKYPCYIQPKLDGIRCIATKKDGKVILMSRGNKEFNLPHLSTVLMGLPDGVSLDGELYIPGVTFQEITSWVRKLQDDSARIQYWVYDLVDSNKNFVDRCGGYEKIVEVIDSPLVQYVDTLQAVDDTVISFAHDTWVEGGYEGLIVRHGDCTYKEGRRSRQLLKVKRFFDEEFEIIGAEENKGKMAGQCCFLMKTADGTEFKCKPKGNEAIREEYWRNKDNYIGKMMTVRFFEWTDSTPPVPRFPIGISIRDYE